VVETKILDTGSFDPREFQRDFENAGEGEIRFLTVELLH
jgi:hypothetical protein